MFIIERACSRIRPLALTWSVLLLGTMSLSACGGGDKKTAEPNTPPVDPPLSLTLDGLVTDAPIANATVTITVGTTTATATSDANGAYRVVLSLPANTANQLMSLTAQGSGEQSNVVLESLIGTVQGLISQAGTDGVLDANENLRANITNLSTAEAVLVREANGGALPGSDAALLSLTQSVDGNALLELAAAIKLIVDDPNFSLPQGVTDTRAFAASSSTRSSFIEEVKTTNPEALSNAQQQVANDPAVSGQASAAKVPPLFYAAQLPRDVRTTYNQTNLVDGFALQSDGSGSYFNSRYSVPVSWSIEGNSVRADFAEAQQTTGFETKQINGTPTQIPVTYTDTRVDVVLLSNSLASIRKHRTAHFPNHPEFADEVRGDLVARTLLIPGTGTADFLPANFGSADTRLLGPIANARSNALRPIDDDLLLLSANGSFAGQYSGIAGTWTRSGRSSLTLTDTADNQITYRGLAGQRQGVDSQYLPVLVEVTTAQSRLVDLGAVTLAGTPLSFDAGSLPGTYYQFGVGDEQDLAETRLLGFRLRFAPDGTGYQGGDFLNTVDGETEVVNTDQPPYGENFFHWSVDANSGEVQLRRYLEEQTLDPFCDPSSSTCKLWDARDLIPFSLADGRQYWLERRQVRYPALQSDTPVDFLNRFYLRGAIDSGLAGVYESLDDNGSASHRYVVWINAQGGYMLATHEDDPDCEQGTPEEHADGNGMEAGSFTYDTISGRFEAFGLTIDSNGECGLSHQSPDSPIYVSKDNAGRLLLQEGDDSFVFQSVPSQANQLVGAWRVWGGDEEPPLDQQILISFFADGEYAMAHPYVPGDCDGTGDQFGGIERGRYTYTASTGELTVDQADLIIDTVGECGLADPINMDRAVQTSTVTLAQDGLSFTAIDNLNEPFAGVKLTRP